MKISFLKIENIENGCVTDKTTPRISFAIESERQSAELACAKISVGDWNVITSEQSVYYGGAPLEPFTCYTVKAEVTDSFGETDTAERTFHTGRLSVPWQGKWITDKRYKFTEKRVSPVPMMFSKKLDLGKKISSAQLYMTAMGIYEAQIDGKKVGDTYFAPGFTSYRSTLMYQTYDVTDMIDASSLLTVTVAGGWAVGSFVFTRKNRITAKRQALLAELRITFEDGTTAVIGTDESWKVSMQGPYRAADLYDGETFDGTVDIENIDWHDAGIEKLNISPEIVADFGAPVRAHEVMTPVSVTRVGNELVYDFGQNFAGVISAKIDGKRGQKIAFRHAEMLNSDGTLNTALLRSAKATAEYICKDGTQEYSPRLTYMGFRYVSVIGIDEKDIELTALALYSDLETTGRFECSDERINKLQQNIVWSAKSNFMDIPTDCPQRDERMGWTGDIAVFAPTACYNFDMSRFLDKWLRDVKSEQLKTGGIPNTVPVQGYGFPATMPVMAIAFWGDACVLVPWAEYLARGDKSVLEKMYPSMKKYVDACKFWAGFGVGKKKYIWSVPSMFAFGDWIAPDVDKMSAWQKRNKYTGTASLCNTSATLSKIAKLLGKTEDEKYYKKLSEKTADAYVSVFTDGHGKLKEEFQTAYALPLAFGMFDGDERKSAADNLESLVEKNDYCIGTGFPGTPNILFALADNGKADTAFKMLTNEKCPSWLFEVKEGGTTVWERWDALSNTGSDDGTGGMASFNHYASGAVGAFLYTRVAGIEPTSGGYKTFRVKPLVGGGITSACGSVKTPYGEASSSWRVEKGSFVIDVTVPVGTQCTVVLPDGAEHTVNSGKYTFSCEAA